jgi:hypothetical protein
MGRLAKPRLDYDAEGDPDERSGDADVCKCRACLQICIVQMHTTINRAGLR